MDAVNRRNLARAQLRDLLTEVAARIEEETAHWHLADIGAMAKSAWRLSAEAGFSSPPFTVERYERSGPTYNQQPPLQPDFVEMVTSVTAAILPHVRRRHGLRFRDPLITGRTEVLILSADCDPRHAGDWGVGIPVWGNLPGAKRAALLLMRRWVRILEYPMVVTPASYAPAEAPAPGTGPSDPVHSEDFTTVRWDGVHYRFSKGQQTAAIELLWREWEKGRLGLSEKTIGEHAGSASDNFRMQTLFRDHPALGQMIQRRGRGVFGLGPSPSE